MKEREAKDQAEEERNRRKWTFWASIVSSIGAVAAAILALFALIVSNTQIDEARKQTAIFKRQADIAGDAARDTERPWAAFEVPVPTSLEWGNGVLRLRLNARVLNAGGSPALRIRAAIAPDRASGSLPAATDRRCSLLSEPGIVGPDLGHFLLPHDKFDLASQVIDFDRASLRSQDGRIEPVAFVACVVYAQAGGVWFHLSRRVFIVGAKDASPGGIGAIPTDRSIGADDIAIREVIAGNEAD